MLWHGCCLHSDASVVSLVWHALRIVGFRWLPDKFSVWVWKEVPCFDRHLGVVLFCWQLSSWLVQHHAAGELQAVSSCWSVHWVLEFGSALSRPALLFAGLCFLLHFYFAFGTTLFGPTFAAPSFVIILQAWFCQQRLTSVGCVIVHKAQQICSRTLR